jgi:hypothetical protein
MMIGPKILGLTVSFQQTWVEEEIDEIFQQTWVEEGD